jgi:transcriptional regulator with XRE-family HTH domain
MSPRRLGLSIRRLREAKGWDQKELARRAAISQPYLSQLETGSRPDPAISVVRKVAKALGVSLDELVT